MGQLNIKDETLIAEAKELAALLGTSATAALREAVQTRLAQERRDRAALADELMAIGRRAAARLTPEQRRPDHAELYDDSGLPR
jgi:antitoxin VapB